MFIAVQMALNQHFAKVKEAWHVWWSATPWTPTTHQEKQQSLATFRAGWKASQPHGLED